MRVPGSNNQVKPGIRMLAPTGNPHAVNLSSLEEVGLVKPEILSGLANFYMEEANPLTRLIMYCGGKVDLVSGMMVKSGNDEQLSQFENFVSQSIKRIDRYRFMYGVQVANGIMPYFTREAEGERNSANQFVGNFTVYISTPEVGVDETIRLANQPQPSLLKVLRVEQTGNVTKSGKKESRLLVKAMLASGSIAPNLVGANQEFAFGYHIAPENSSKGMKPKSEGFGQNFVHNVITTMRFQSGVSGHAHNSALNHKVFEYVFPSKDGKGKYDSITFYVDYLKDKMYRDRVNAMAEYIWHAQRETEDGTAIHPDTGQTVFSGDGVLALTNPKLRRPITGSIINWIRDTAEVLLRDDPNASTVNRPKFIVVCPMNVAKQASQEMAKTFGLNPMPLFAEEGGQRGVDERFSLYKAVEADYMFVGHNFFNSRNQPRMLNANGEMINNNCVYMLNVSEYDKGQSNIVLVQNREMVVGAKLQGMADVKSGGVISNTVDSVEFHDLIDLGVAIPNPNFLSIGYFTK
jgi:hypothetical protein